MENSIEYLSESINVFQEIDTIVDTKQVEIKAGIFGEQALQSQIKQHRIQNQNKLQKQDNIYQDQQLKISKTKIFDRNNQVYQQQSPHQLIEIIIDQQNKSPRKQGFMNNFKRKSFYSKNKSFIPSLKQVKQREENIKYFHNRNFYRKQKRLENIFKQNCRIYQNLQTQKSFYQNQFKKTKNSHAVSCSQYSSTKTNVIALKQRCQNFDSNTFKIQRKSLVSKKDSKQKSIKYDRLFKRTKSTKKYRSSKDDEYFKQNKILRDESSLAFIKIGNRYEKNKTQMSRNNIKNKNKQNNSFQYTSFKVNPSSKQEKQFSKYICLKNKRRPSSAFRF